MTYTLSESQHRRSCHNVADIDRFVSVVPMSPVLASLPFFVPSGLPPHDAQIPAPDRDAGEDDIKALADALRQTDCEDVVLKAGCVCQHQHAARRTGAIQLRIGIVPMN